MWIKLYLAVLGATLAYAMPPFFLGNPDPASACVTTATCMETALPAALGLASETLANVAQCAASCRKGPPGGGHMGPGRGHGPMGGMGHPPPPGAFGEPEPEGEHGSYPPFGAEPEPEFSLDGDADSDDDGSDRGPPPSGGRPPRPRFGPGGPAGGFPPPPHGGPPHGGPPHGGPPPGMFPPNMQPPPNGAFDSLQKQGPPKGLSQLPDFVRNMMSCIQGELGGNLMTYAQDCLAKKNVALPDGVDFASLMPPGFRNELSAEISATADLSTRTKRMPHGGPGRGPPPGGDSKSAAMMLLFGQEMLSEQCGEAAEEVTTCIEGQLAAVQKSMADIQENRDEIFSKLCAMKTTCKIDDCQQEMEMKREQMEAVKGGMCECAGEALATVHASGNCAQYPLPSEPPMCPKPGEGGQTPFVRPPPPHEQFCETNPDKAPTFEELKAVMQAQMDEMMKNMGKMPKAKAGLDVEASASVGVVEPESEPKDNA